MNRPLDLLDCPEPLDLTEQMMAEVCTGSRLDWLGPVVQEHLDAGGKRLRARLALATVATLGGEPRRGVAWASACELLHNASLIHDDLQDGDRYRRGQPSVWARHGEAQAINAGDLMLMLPFVCIESAPVDDATKWHLSRLLARGGETLARGQAAELNLVRLGQTQWPAYEHAVLGKTAALFSLPVAGGALCAGWEVARAEALGQAVAPLGLAFQVADDLLDLYGDKGREPATDLIEGRVNAVVVHHLSLYPEDRADLLGLLQRPRSESNSQDVADYCHRFRTGGAVEAVHARLTAIQRRLESDQSLAEAPALHETVLTLFHKATHIPVSGDDTGAPTLRMLP